MEKFKVTIDLGNNKHEDAVFIYDYSKMSAEQRFDAKAKATLYQRIYIYLPESPSDLETILTRNSYAKAIAALLIKENEKYNPEKPASEAILSNIYGEDIDRLEGCFVDFCDKTGIVSAESIVRQNDMNKLAEANPILLNAMAQIVRNEVHQSINEITQGLSETMQLIKNTELLEIANKSESLPTTTKSRGKKSSK